MDDVTHEVLAAEDPFVDILYEHGTCFPADPFILPAEPPAEIYAAYDHERPCFLYRLDDGLEIGECLILGHLVLEVVTPEGDQNNPRRPAQNIPFEPPQRITGCISRNSCIDNFQTRQRSEL